MSRDDGTLLVASDTPADADMIRNALALEFSHVEGSSDADRIATDFDRVTPDVLVLAFNAIAKAEQYYLALFRHSKVISDRPHRTVLLCNKDEVRTAYDLCRRECFDDYVLFWPVTFDQPRLAMSVRLALRDLATTRQDVPNQRRLAEAAREFASVEPLLDRAIVDGDRRLAAAGAALRQLEDGLGSAVNDISTGLTRQLGAMNVGSGMIREVTQRLRTLSDDHLMPQLRATAGIIAPVRESLTAASAAYRPRLASVRKIASQNTVTPNILIVEDEETQRQIYKHLLDRGRYALTFAATGSEAMRMAERVSPDLILMDVMLPDFNGVDVTRRLKSTPALAAIPVLIITGQSERAVVMESLEAGAADFLVKPFTPQALLVKVQQYFPAAAPVVAPAQA
jgi:CheY-like chemotaxis protein